MPRALILGGTGPIGRAAAARLLPLGWQVDLTGRDPTHLPAELARAGAGFVAADRGDEEQLRAALGEGADLLVDCICFTAADATRLLPLAAQRDLDGADLEQGGLRRCRRQPLELGDGAALRRPDPGDAAHDGPRRRPLRLARGLRREQGRRRAGRPRQRPSRHGPAPVEDPRRGSGETARMGLRQASARSPARRLPRQPRRRRRPHHRRREHRVPARDRCRDSRAVGS